MKKRKAKKLLKEFVKFAKETTGRKITFVKTDKSDNYNTFFKESEE